MLPPALRIPLLLLAAASASGCFAHTPAIPGPDGRPEMSAGLYLTLGEAF